MKKILILALLLMPLCGVASVPFSLRLDNEPIADEVRFETYGRSEEWKENVLRNQAIRTFRIPCKNKPQKLKIKSLTEGVIVDQVIVY